MPFVGRCPFCGQRSRIPEASLGASGQCPRCGSFYTLTPVDEAADNATAAGPAAPRSSLGAATDSVLHSAEASAGEPSWTAPSARPRPEPLGATALLVAAAALVAASIPFLCALVIPLAGLALLLAVLGYRRTAAGRSRLLPTAASLSAAALLLAAWCWPALLGPVYQAARTRQTLDPAALYAVPLPGHHGVTSDPDWVDADAAALRQGDVLVRVTGVWTGRSAGDGKQLSANNPECLFVRVQGFKGKRKDARPASAPQAPRLTDDRNHELAALGSQRASASGKEAAQPSFFDEHVFSFAAPKAGIEHLRLELPGALWGSSTVFRFKIPAAMIRQEQPR
jgi:hypothetical protein